MTEIQLSELLYDLQLSRPTVTTNLAALENDGLIQKNGLIDMEFVGRKKPLEYFSHKLSESGQHAPPDL